MKFRLLLWLLPWLLWLRPAQAQPDTAGVVVLRRLPENGIFLNHAASQRDHVLTYVVRDFRVLEVKRPDGEIAEAGFFPLDGLPETTTRATRARIDEILSGRPPPPVW